MSKENYGKCPLPSRRWETDFDFGKNTKNGGTAMVDRFFEQ